MVRNVLVRVLNDSDVRVGPQGFVAQARTLPSLVQNTTSYEVSGPWSKHSSSTRWAVSLDCVVQHDGDEHEVADDNARLCCRRVAVAVRWRPRRTVDGKHVPAKPILLLQRCGPQMALCSRYSAATPTVSGTLRETGRGQRRCK